MESDQSVLLLNSTYEPLTVVHARRALKLLFSKKAHTIEESNHFMSTVRARIRVPSVIQIVYFVKKPYSKPKFSKRSVFIRDNYQCQYCGKYSQKPTIDHVIPRCKSGKNDWANVVTACHECNNKKGDRTLKEAGMRLIRQPKEPQYMVYSTIITPHKMRRWEKYFNPQEKVPEALMALTTS
jgi:5-methylcytosine-specific restriction endonuclease McrA